MKTLKQPATLIPFLIAQVGFILLLLMLVSPQINATARANWVPIVAVSLANISFMLWQFAKDLTRPAR